MIRFPRAVCRRAAGSLAASIAAPPAGGIAGFPQKFFAEALIARRQLQQLPAGIFIFFLARQFANMSGLVVVMLRFQ